MKNRGVSLLELLVVITMIGVLAIVAFISYSGMTERARTSEVYTVMSLVREAEKVYFNRYDTFTNNWDNLIVSGIPANSEATGGVIGCVPSHWFSYIIHSGSGSCNTGIPGAPVLSEPCFRVVGVRCTSGGKEPQGKTAYRIRVSENANGSQIVDQCGASWPFNPECKRIR